MNSSLRTKLTIFGVFAPLAAILLCASAIPAPPRAKKGHGAAAPAKAAPKKVSAPAAPARTFAKEVAPVLDKYCIACHSGESPSGGVKLTGFKDAAGILKQRSLWERVSATVNAGHMPPAGMPRPPQEMKDRFLGYIDATITQADCRIDDPGRVTMRRLNREEYNNTVRDLIGVDIRPADDFPSDDVGYGFDNIGDVLSISPLLMEKYLKAADKVAKAAIIAPETKAASGTPRFTGSALDGEGIDDFPETGGRLLGTERALLRVAYTFPHEGEYLVRIGAFAQQAGPEPARMGVRLDGKEIQVFEVKAVPPKPEVYTLRVRVPAGRHRLAMQFLNNYRMPDLPPPNDRNLIIDFVEIEDPQAASGTLPASHKRIIACKPVPGIAPEKDVCTRQTIGNFARRAWRRPVKPDEVSRLARYVGLARREGESFERGIQLAVQATLVSPNFLFRVEKNAPGDKSGLLGDYELASRLSYFLWSSMPDEELFALAAKKKLRDPNVLAAQAKRMLKSPKAANALAKNFAGQWLLLRKLDTAAPDPRVFPTWNEGLKQAMRTETELFFEAIVKEDRSVLEFIDAKFTYLNEPLARHYGNTEVTGPEFRKVALTGNQRGGLLTQASILTVTSNPTRTSPVKRGKWVLEQILGTPPPPAPPGVAELPDDQRRGRNAEPLSGTLRQRLEQHRKDPTCASCHMRMDPIGFGLENFDPIGAWREKDGEADVDASGTLPDGKSFKGPAELRKILLDKKGLFVRSFSERMLTYALGRGVESTDKCHVDEVSAALTKSGYKFSALVVAVVQNDMFRKRRVEPAASPQKPNRIAAR